MKDIFLISDKQANFNIFYKNLGHLPIHLSWGGDVEQAIQALPLEKPSCVFLVTENLDALENWIDWITEKDLGIPLVVFTKQLELAARERIWEKDIIELIQLPRHYKEFEFIVKSIILNHSSETQQEKSLIQGYLQDFSFVELIQTFSDAGKNGILTVFKGNRSGDVQFNRGKIVNAHLREYEPLEAIRTIATWFTGTFKMNLDKTVHRENITLDNQQVITQGLEEIRNRNQLVHQLPDLSHKFYTTPDLNYEQVEPIDRKFLLLFKDGATLNQIVEMHPGHTVRMLERFKKWLDGKYLIEPAEYDQKILVLQEKGKMSGIKKIFSKIFSKPTGASKGRPAAKTASAESMEEEVTRSSRSKKQIYSDFDRLEGFINALEGMQ